MHLYDNVGEDVNKILQAFYLNDEEELNKLLHSDNYQRIIETLYNTKIIPGAGHNDYNIYSSGDPKNDTLYEQNRVFYGNAIQGAQNSRNKLGDAITKIKLLEDKIFLLQNPRLRPALEAHTTLNVAATIRPEIKEYIRIYGYPENHIFDPDFLAEILARLG